MSTDESANDHRADDGEPDERSRSPERPTRRPRRPPGAWILGATGIAFGIASPFLTLLLMALLVYPATDLLDAGLRDGRFGAVVVLILVSIATIASFGYYLQRIPRRAMTVVTLLLLAGGFGLSIGGSAEDLTSAGWLIFLVACIHITILLTRMFLRWADTVLSDAHARAYYQRRGLCPYCQYDVVNLTSERCPECGGRVGRAEYFRKSGRKSGGTPG